MIVLSVLIVVAAAVLLGLLFGSILDVALDVIVSFIGAEIIGHWLIGMFIFPFDIKIALLVVFFVLMRIGKYKIKHGK